MGKLIIISAPSGAGKTTLCQRLLQDFPNLVLSISSTTRLPRGSEEDGREYFFISKKDFEKAIQKGLFAEWAEVHGNYYGTSREVIDRAFAAGNSVLLDIDVQGATSLARAYPKECVRFFIAPPSLAELEFRLRARGTDSEETIRKRMRAAEAEMASKDSFDHVIVNDSLERAYRELRDLVSQSIGAPSGAAGEQPGG